MQRAIREAKKQKPKVLIDLFSLSLVLTVLFFVIASARIYTQVFDGALSHEPNSWSAFGSFFGGLFGPLISFLTLLAILKTIQLQRELLDTQRAEFEAMQGLQARTLESQLAQIDRANVEADRRVLEEFRLSLIRLVEKYTKDIVAECDVKRQRSDMLMQWHVDGKANVTRERFEKVKNAIARYNKQIIGLYGLYDALHFAEFSDISSMKEYYTSEMDKIFGKTHPSPNAEE